MMIREIVNKLAKCLLKTEYKTIFDTERTVSNKWEHITTIDMSQYKRYGFIFTNLDKRRTYDVQIFGNMLESPNEDVMELKNGWYNMRSVDWEGAYPAMYYSHTDLMGVGGGKSSAYWGSIPVKHIAIYTKGHSSSGLKVKISGCVSE